VVPGLHYWEFGNVLRTYVISGPAAADGRAHHHAVGGEAGPPCRASRVRLTAPAIEGFQAAASFAPADRIRVEPGRGWRLVLAT
jgi:hypothetical protein